LLPLLELDITFNMAEKLIDRYGDRALEVLRRNPYQAEEDIGGIGFKRADAIALRVGLQLNSPFRIEAGILHAIREAANQGHCFLTDSQLIQATRLLLEYVV